MDLFHRLLLQLEPERAHDAALGALRWSTSLPGGAAALRLRFRPLRDPRLEQEVLGLRFPNPVGLAAGFDKNARAVAGLATLGFGFVEVGTVTPRPQPGNPKPRIFRHPQRQTLQNALGFNNEGGEVVARRLEAGRPFGMPVGVNIGKNADTPLEKAESDYAALFERFSTLADYFTVNVSSPNTPGLRDLQSPERVATLLSLGLPTERPILVKLAPDLEAAHAVDAASAAVEAGAAGVILTNTTTRYDLLPGVEERGGLSGQVLTELSAQLFEAVARELFGRAVLISVGGIDSADEAVRRLRAGASLVQVYTGLVYRGPGLVKSLERGVLDEMAREGCATLNELVGVDRRRAAETP